TNTSIWSRRFKVHDFKSETTEAESTVGSPVIPSFAAVFESKRDTFRVRRTMLRYFFFLTAILLISTSSASAGSPRLVRLSPPGGQRGTTVEAYFQGRYLDKPQEVLLYEPGISVEAVEALEGEVSINGRKERVEAGTRVRVRLKLSDDCELGPHG